MLVDADLVIANGEPHRAAAQPRADQPRRMGAAADLVIRHSDFCRLDTPRPTPSEGAICDSAEVSIHEERSESEKPMVANRRQLSIENALAQLGWEPTYRSVCDSTCQNVDQRRAFHCGRAVSAVAR